MVSSYFSLLEHRQQASVGAWRPVWLFLSSPDSVACKALQPHLPSDIIVHQAFSIEHALLFLQKQAVTHLFVVDDFPLNDVKKFISRYTQLVDYQVSTVWVSSMSEGASSCSYESLMCLFDTQLDLSESELVLATQLRLLAKYSTHQLRLERFMWLGYQMLNTLPDAVMVVNDALDVLFMNKLAMQLLSITPYERVESYKLNDFMHDAASGELLANQQLIRHACQKLTDISHVESLLVTSTGAILPVECSISSLKQVTASPASLLVFRDISVRKQFEEELKWQINHDHLTGLLNRSSFNELLEAEVQRLRRSREQSAVLFIDLDRFKYINDTCGHHAGDQLLIDISRKFRARLRGSDSLARLAGDEFAVLLRNVDSTLSVTLAEQYRNILEDAYFSHNNISFDITGSIGISVIDSGTSSAQVALANADGACYLAKHQGRNRVYLYDPERDSSVVFIKDEGWSARIDEALRNSTFVVHYQMVLPLQTMCLECIDRENPPKTLAAWRPLITDMDECRYELLIRLPVDGVLVMPAAFISLAERFNLMDSIDRWMISKAMDILMTFKKIGVQHKLCINLSGQSVKNNDFGDWLIASLKHYGIAPSQIVFEINERVVLTEIHTARSLMQQLSAIGVQFVLDEFGSGLGSLIQLQNLPVAGVKIDANLIRNIMTNPVEQALLRSINDMVHAMGMYAVATKVEQFEQLEYLRQAGTDFVQGHYLLPPLEQLPSFLLR